jgi:hypothetical protein
LRRARKPKIVSTRRPSRPSAAFAASRLISLSLALTSSVRSIGRPAGAYSAGLATSLPFRPLSPAAESERDRCGTSFCPSPAARLPEAERVCALVLPGRYQSPRGNTE